MEFLVDVAEAVAGDVGVNFGGADGGVAQEFLDDAQVGAMLEQVGGEAVPEHVGGDVPLHSRAAHAVFDALPQSHGRERFVVAGQKHGRRRFGGDQFGPAGGEVLLQRGHGNLTDGHHTFLVALAYDIDETGLEVELFEAQVF